MSTLEVKTVSAACAGRMLGLGKAKTLQLVHSGRLPANARLAIYARVQYLDKGRFE